MESTAPRFGRGVDQTATASPRVCLVRVGHDGELANHIGIGRHRGCAAAHHVVVVAAVEGVADRQVAGAVDRKATPALQGIVHDLDRRHAGNQQRQPVQHGPAEISAQDGQVADLFFRHDVLHRRRRHIDRIAACLNHHTLVLLTDL